MLWWYCSMLWVLQFWLSSIFLGMVFDGRIFWSPRCCWLHTAEKEKGWIKRYFFYGSLVVACSWFVVAGECRRSGSAFPVWCVEVQKGNAQGVRRDLLGILVGCHWQKVEEGAGCWRVWSSGLQRLFWFWATAIASIVEIAWRGRWWMPEGTRSLSVKRIE